MLPLLMPLLGLLQLLRHQRLLLPQLRPKLLRFLLLLRQRLLRRRTLSQLLQPLPLPLPPLLHPELDILHFQLLPPAQIF